MEALRGTVKAKLTRLERKVDELAEEQPLKERIEVYTARLEEIRCEYDDVNQRIIAIQGDEASQDDEREEEEFEDRYLKLRIQLKRLAQAARRTRTTPLRVSSRNKPNYCAGLHRKAAKPIMSRK